ncbi:CPBP family intramembrane metalloprotease [Nocardia sp. ET3-3]|uniref:CPBP family intramembrane metalloprotease n=1 Tax=Nocardia terrae TaxID=2675851 RepID=A0A7K1VBJ4_9NOCA|nr:CPBP family intramembrane glutamic endopeptidase [Nocardia terrae]MVU83772.1 CPBP family intramembrane metalloprotease [Nocardia terrae]
MSQADGERVAVVERSVAVGRRGRAVRAVVACAVVAVYVVLGFVLHLGVNAYLLLGIPFTLLFPLVLHRRPVRELWVRRASPPVDRWTPVQVDRWVWVMFAVLAVVPVRGLSRLLTDTETAWQWSEIGYSAATIGGAFALAWALRGLGRAGARRLAACLATAGLIGVSTVVGGFLLSGQGAPSPAPWASLRLGLESLLMYVPVVFVLEEVFFRGALDSYLHRDGEPGGLWSAALVSALWGLWHLPVAGVPITGGVVAGLLAFQIPVGMFLSLWWRRSGNLAVPGITHAVIDSVRNGLGV